ncbi:hypothetical protein HGRIS_007966 [Hohenbuehelia grisea]|uniref:rRNA biogenesis protein RRP36 n=1 Tax=Hohenbuehelia grisea TaxID=104357 RepID=A0ABR3J6V1_9AGAR
MPRRPRAGPSKSRPSEISKGKRPAKPAHKPAEASGSEASGLDDEAETFEGFNFDEAKDDAMNDDLDGPRVAQWIDEDELEQNSSDADSESDAGEEGAEEPDLKSLQDNLGSLPLGALRRAQRTLAQATVDSDSDKNDSDGDSDEDGPPAKQDTTERKPEWTSKPSVKPTKRSSKHAPTEVTSKRPVTRNRQVVEVQKLEARDPRFLPLAGEFDASKFQQQYGFLAKNRVSELHTLRDSLKRARKLLSSTPRDQRAEREAEIGRLELAIKRAESAVNRDKREKIDQAALAKVTKEEKEKRQQGKQGWWLKDSEKKELLVRARYEALAAEGGRQAVKKAIEKKQLKISQKEKKSRPFREERGGRDIPPHKRRADGQHASSKRRKLA